MPFALIAAALAAASTPSAPAIGQPQLPDADPAIWVVNDHDTTIYLFGTFHALDGKSQWFNDEVKTAFVASDELVLETIVPEWRPRGFFRPSNVPKVAEQPFKSGASFLASTRLALSVGKSRGLSFEKGADAVLRAAAQDAGKKVSGIESFEFQVEMFGKIPAARAPAPVAGESVDAVEKLSIVMIEMQAAWNRGDGEIFATMLEGMRSTSPETYRMMFVDRNGRWADWIANRLQQPGTVFVAVGAGHLAGPDSVQNKLAQIGVRSARIN